MKHLTLTEFPQSALLLWYPDDIVPVAILAVDPGRNTGIAILHIERVVNTKNAPPWEARATACSASLPFAELPVQPRGERTGRQQRFVSMNEAMRQLVDAALKVDGFWRAASLEYVLRMHYAAEEMYFDAKSPSILPTVRLEGQLCEALSRTFRFDTARLFQAKEWRTSIGAQKQERAEAKLAANHFAHATFGTPPQPVTEDEYEAIGIAWHCAHVLAREHEEATGTDAKKTAIAGSKQGEGKKGRGRGKRELPEHLEDRVG